mmetsp:Transcript_102716/g.260941  ORF Transcript_102716/g.260941 Transcript_102716/m.260941 type:complete len:278 (-) Transcript_102716:175-1008(-)|eukprot:CAMPEP_0183415124 /NCGR_PEP_ID=MMETSP0370-20130417/22867_1 /TAXON_ID=268820 /ORGANISM="Peridinium aciculiferum, Strain PAER-2" /LENGTH=277 /DNA_ID=CAMNT_0025598513 /DNA_START=39 /DNA_END=872 /DNA_ORIENTATION=+
MALPPVLVGILFLVAVLGALGLMAYVAYRGSKPSSFFTEAVQTEYDLEISEAEIDAYYEIKDKLQETFAPETIDAALTLNEDGEEVSENVWLRNVPLEPKGELKKALVRRLLSCISKLEQVQRDKPGQWKLWQSKLISERYWDSLCDAERNVSQEIDACIAEAEEIEPGWKDHIFPQAVHLYRLSKQHEAEKKMVVQEKKDVKKEAQKQVNQALADKRKEIEEIVRRERASQKAMEQLLAEEEKMAMAKTKSGKGKDKGAAVGAVASTKSKATKKTK